MINSTFVPRSTLVASLESTEKLSVIIPEKIPAFFREEYPTLIEFIKSYARFGQGNREGYTEKIESIKDLDLIGKKYLEAFYENYAKDMPVFPYSSMADFIRNAKLFYTSRGSEDSFKYLFRVMFGEEIAIKYPSENMLRASSGKWVQNVSVYLRMTAGDFDEGSIGKKLLIKSETGTTISLKIIRVANLGGDLREVFVENFLSQEILEGDRFFFDYDGSTGKYSVQGRIVSTINRMEILDQGSGFRLGDELVLSTPGSSQFSIRIVSTDLQKGIKKAEFQTFPGESTSQFQLSIPSEDGEDAIINFFPGTINRYSGYYENTDGFLSDSNKLQDNFYYQVFSYVISSQVQKDVYEALVQKILHPSGLQMFGEYQLVNEIQLSTQIALEFTSSAQFVDSLSIYDELQTTLTAERNYSDTVMLTDSFSLETGKSFEEQIDITEGGLVEYFEVGDYFELGYTEDTVYTRQGYAAYPINN